MKSKTVHQKFKIPMKQGVCDVDVATPADFQAHSAVLLLMDAFGPRPYLSEMADRMASMGFCVLLPNLFYRTQPAPFWTGEFPVSAEKMPDLLKVVIPLAKSYSPEMALEDGKIFLQFLTEQQKIKAGAVAVTGYCMGGAIALRLAAEFPEQIAAAASFHAGRLVTETADSPHLKIPQVISELYFAHADEDPSMTQEQIQKLEDALKHGPVYSESEVYEGAAHGFTMKDLPAYQEKGLQRHWQKLTSLLQRNLPQSHPN